MHSCDIDVKKRANALHEITIGPSVIFWAYVTGRMKCNMITEPMHVQFAVQDTETKSELGHIPDGALRSAAATADRSCDP